MLVKAPELIFFSGSKESSSRVLSIQRMMILLKSEATWATHSERGDNGDGGEIGGLGGGYSRYGCRQGQWRRGASNRFDCGRERLGGWRRLGGAEIG